MATPTRVQMKMKQGEVVNAYDEYLGRCCYRGGWQLSKSPFANPFPIGKEYTLEQSLNLYRGYLTSDQHLMGLLPTLAGKKLGCFCPLNEECHVDIVIDEGSKKGFWDPVFIPIRI